MFDLTKPAEFGQTLLVTLIGMAIVILGLTVLIFLIKGLVKITDGLGKKKQPEDEPAEDSALVAAITAALMCVMEDNQGFVVRRIRRV